MGKRVGATGRPLASKSTRVATILRPEEIEALNEMLEEMGVTRYQYARALILRDMVERGYLEEKTARGKDRMLSGKLGEEEEASDGH